MKKILTLICLFLLLVSFSRIADPAARGNDVSSSNGIYHWKTRFSLNDYELNFLRRHDISRIYVRMFDVALQNDSANDTLAITPIATTRFESPIPEGVEIVPTVYITYDALAYLNGKHYKDVESYVKRILTRIDAMASFHEINDVKEVQFDCDWTSNTSGAYSTMCSCAKRILNQDGMKFSITLRLHQMGMSSYHFPRADRGVLMLYNTGSFKDPGSTNSILTYDDAEPYLRRHEVPFPVDYAYPTYSWSLLYRNDEFRCIARNINFTDSTLFMKTDYNKFLVQKDTLMGGTSLKKGDMIRHECSEFKEIERVKSDLSRRHDMKDSRHIIYHLDSANLSKFSDDEIKYMLLAY